MSSPYIGEIRLFAGTFAPQGWSFCDGTLLSIAANDALFALIGTTYGGDGVETFALPDLRGRAMVGIGSNGFQTYTLGENGGTETVTLTVAQIPPHGIPTSSAEHTTTRPTPTSVLAGGGAYRPLADANTALAPVGGGQPHENMPPYLVVSFIIALFGIFPSQT